MFGLGTCERIRTWGVRSDPAATTTTSASTRWVSPKPSVYSTPVASGPSPRSSISTRSTNEFGRSASAPDSTFRWMYVFIVDLPAFVGQPWRHEPHCSQFSST